MKKMMPGMTAAVAACLIVAGCKVPKNERLPRTSRNTAVAVSADVEAPATSAVPATPAASSAWPATPVAPAVDEPVPTSDIEVTPIPEPTPAPEAVKPVAEPAPAAPAPMVYTIQRGDTVSILSKRFNVRMDAIEKANPGLNRDKVRIGQKINIPAVSGDAKGEQAAKPATPAAPKPDTASKPQPKTVVDEYTGPVKEYVVKAGDTLGAIAYANGINIRQLKKLNDIPMGQQNNTVRIGQKLKIPAEPVVRTTKQPAKPEQPAPKDVKPEEVKPAPEVTTPEPVVVPQPAEEVVVDNKITKTAPVVVPPAPPVAEPVKDAGVRTYTTQDGDDIVQLAIEFEIAPGQLVDANSDILSTPADTLKPGMVLKLPANAKVKK